MNRTIKKLSSARFVRPTVIVVLILAVVVCANLPNVYGAELPNRSLLLSTSEVNAIATYQLSFQIPASETLGSIQLEFCANDPLFTDPCTTPAGLDVSGGVLSAQSGATGFTISPATNANTLILTRTPAITPEVDVSYTLTGVVNPSSPGAYYGRLQTFASDDASGTENDHGGLAFDMNSPIQISTTVPPYLLFCTGVTITGDDCSTASGDYINFGNFSDAATSSAQTQLLTATNADTGYEMYVYGSTMTSGNNIINAMATPDVSRPGVSQFGMNLVANQTPSVGENPQGLGQAEPTADYDQPNFFKFNSGDEIASATQPDNYREFTASYIVNIPNGQAQGVYVATLTYICLANF